MTRNFVGARGIESIFTTTTSGTTAAFPLYDCHGNMVATVARNGAGFTTSNVRTYDVWGGVRTGATTGGPKGRYVANLGHVQDDESGLIYMRARYYEPESGRFISEDPARDGSNWYVYVENNSPNSADINGKVGIPLLVTLLMSFAIMFGANTIYDWKTYGHVDVAAVVLKGIVDGVLAPLLVVDLVLWNVAKQIWFQYEMAKWARMTMAGATIGVMFAYSMMLLAAIMMINDGIEAIRYGD